jgi:putative cardiolipin synthase
MPLFEVLASCLVVIALATTAAFYSYGRFARRAKGEPSSALPVRDDATPLDRELAPLLRNHDGATGLVLLSDNRHAFEMRVLTARNAGRSLDLQYYYWCEDLTGNLLAREILAAADRGVRVRMLIDDINTRGNDTSYLALDSHPHIEVRLFNPSRNRSNGLRRGLELALRAFKTTRRMHNKSWIADGRLAIVGGRNIGDAYFGAAKITNFHDMDLLFVGKSLRSVQDIFDDFWNSAVAIPIGALSRPISRRLHTLNGPKNCTIATDAEPYLQHLAKLDSCDGLLRAAGQLSWTTEVEVVSDPAEKAWAVGQKSWLADRIYKTIETARDELRIVSPYFIPGDRGVDALRRLSKGGVAVSVLTNSLAATDVVAVHGAYASYRKPLLRSGVELFELRPDMPAQRASLFGSKGASLHTKAFTVDRRTGFIGSFNFDPRSASLNTEMGVLFSDRTLVEQVNSVVHQQTTSASAFRVSLIDDRVAWSDHAKIGDAPGVCEPSASRWRRFAAGVIRILPLESQL